MKKIALVGAFDRYNYGDVLMPMIIQSWYALHNYDYHFDCYGIKEADLTSVGANSCRSLKELYQNIDCYDACMIVGGEVISAEFRTMLPMLLDAVPYPLPKCLEFLLTVCARISNTITNNICGRVLKIPSVMPWIIHSEDTKVIYNTVGGARNIQRLCSRNKNIISAINDLKKSPYISVRSQADYETLKRFRISSVLIPDSVSCISECWSPEWIKTYADEITIRQIDNIGKYFAFQINAGDYHRFGEDEVINSLESTCRNNDMKCLLVPIGYAAAHDDLPALKHINNHTSENITLLHGNSIYDVTHALISAQCYAGTSLHGAIVSGSYCVPHTSFNRRDNKTASYLKCWSTTSYPSIDITDLSTVVKNLCSKTDGSTVKRNMQHLIEQVDQNFYSISEAIEYNGVTHE